VSEPGRGADLFRDLVARFDGAGPDDRAAAFAQVTTGDIETVLHAQGTGERTVLAVGLAASPGLASGVAMFDAWRGLDAVDDGAEVILVRPETSPADEPCLSVANGVLTSRGGMASHAAVIARGRGLPAVCGATSLVIGEDQLTTPEGVVVREGDTISIDGSSGEVLLGALDIVGAAVPDDLHTVLGWADEARAGRLAVRANADTAAEAAVARSLGAEGIGLCRTEHQFLGPQRLPLLQRAILAGEPEVERAVLDELAVVQRADFEALLEVMDGLPVTVRLLDPPLHEFLPDIVALEVAAAAGTLETSGAELLDAARRWHEHNPMLGVRGARLGILRPALYRMQVRALVEAATARLAAGGDPRPQVIVPLVSTVAELVTIRRMIDEEVAAAAPARPPLAVGAMIETPRAALLAGSIAGVADFLSFGTNDLTQMTFGFSRDDVGRLLEAYLREGLLEADPFVSLDLDGVGQLVTMAVRAARATRPDLSIGLCGEHGADPRSIGFLLDAGVDYLSCSPWRVPVARLAAAQSVVAQDGGRAAI
jgi:pyruvate, orthophosphate dikinase